MAVFPVRWIPSSSMMSRCETECFEVSLLVHFFDDVVVSLTFRHPRW